MMRSVPNSQAGTGVRLTGPRWTNGNHAVVGASTKFPRFRLRIQRSSDRGVIFSLSGRIEIEDVEGLQRLLSLEAAGQDVKFGSQDVTQLRGNRRFTFDTLFDVGVAGSAEVA